MGPALPCSLEGALLNAKGALLNTQWWIPMALTFLPLHPRDTLFAPA